MPKNNYHPLFIILFMLDLLPREVVQTIPRSTLSFNFLTIVKVDGE